MPAKTDKIHDEGLRHSLEEAQGALKTGDYKKVVDLAAAAYVELLKRKPDMMQGQAQFRNVLFFPRLGAHLIVNTDGVPEIVYDRERFIFSEAITYFEFAVDNIVREGV
jgi:hypothetical protein